MQIPPQRTQIKPKASDLIPLYGAFRYIGRHIPETHPDGRHYSTAEIIGSNFIGVGLLMYSLALPVAGVAIAIMNRTEIRNTLEKLF